MKFPILDKFYQALDLINPYINNTPIVSSNSFNKIFNLEIYFKLELMQKTGSFKARGAINKVLQLSEKERKKGVVAISAGNHAQATSWACSQFDIKSTLELVLYLDFDKISSK